MDGNVNDIMPAVDVTSFIGWIGPSPETPIGPNMPP